MNVFPSALAPCKAKNNPPGRTFRESQATWQISILAAPEGRVTSTPWNTAVSVFRSSRELAWAVCFRWLSTWFVAASCTCSSWLNPILILVPCSLEWLRNLWCRCPELHGDPRAAPRLRSRRWRLIGSKTTANENRVQSQSKTHLRYVAHGLSGKVRHLDVTAFIQSYGDRRRRTHAGL